MSWPRTDLGSGGVLEDEGCDPDCGGPTLCWDVPSPGENEASASVGLWVVSEASEDVWRGGSTSDCVEDHGLDIDWTVPGSGGVSEDGGF